MLCFSDTLAPLSAWASSARSFSSYWPAHASPGAGALDGGPGRPGPYDDPDAAAGRRVLDGVVHQIDQRLPDHEAIHPCRNGPRRFDRERLPLFLGQHTEVRRHVTGQLGEI